MAATIYKAATVDGMSRVAVVEFRDGWRVYSRLNNGRTETMPYPRTHYTAADAIGKARHACQIFAPTGPRLTAALAAAIEGDE